MDEEAIKKLLVELRAEVSLELLDMKAAYMCNTPYFKHVFKEIGKELKRIGSLQRPRPPEVYIKELKAMLRDHFRGLPDYDDYNNITEIILNIMRDPEKRITLQDIYGNYYSLISCQLIKFQLRFDETPSRLNGERRTQLLAITSLVKMIVTANGCVWSCLCVDRPRTIDRPNVLINKVNRMRGFVNSDYRPRISHGAFPNVLSLTKLRVTQNHQWDRRYTYGIRVLQQWLPQNADNVPEREACVELEIQVIKLSHELFQELDMKRRPNGLSYNGNGYLEENETSSLYQQYCNTLDAIAIGFLNEWNGEKNEERKADMLPILSKLLKIIMLKMCIGVGYGRRKDEIWSEKTMLSYVALLISILEYTGYKLKVFIEDRERQE